MSPAGPDEPRGAEAPVRRRRPGRFFLRRIIALAVLALLVALIVLAVGWLLGAFGERQTARSSYEDSISAGGEPEVTITNERGSLRITGEKDLERVELEAEIYAAARDSETAEQNASDASVDLARDGAEVTVGGLSGDATGADYELRVPADSSVIVDSGSGGVEVENAAALETSVEAGDLSASGMRGPVSVEAPGGDVSLSGISTGDGDIAAEVGSGDLALEDVEAGGVEAEVESGRASVTEPFSGAGELYVETGDITVDAPPDSVEDLRLDTGVGRVFREEDDSSEEG